MSHHAEAHEYDEPRPAKGAFARFFDRFTGSDDYEEEEPQETEEPPAAPPTQSRASGGYFNRRGTTLRLDGPSRTHITVRRAVHSFDDARRSADGLKDGQQQIVNLEQTPADMSERIIDFLNGATYALDGSVEKIGEQVYLFTPNSFVIDVEDKPVNTSRTSFLDRD